MGNLPEKIDAVIEKSKITDLPKAQKIAANYAPLMNEVTEEIEKLKKLDKKHPDSSKVAKRIRLDLGKICSKADKQKKGDKQTLMLETRFIDALYNTVNGAARLTQDDAKKIEDYAAIQERKRLDKIQAKRVAQIEEYLPDADERDLARMEDDVWEAYFTAKKKEHEDLIAAELQAEKDRVAKAKAEAEEKEKLRLENEKLQKEIDAKDKLAKAEAARIAKEEEARRKIEASKLAEIKSKQDAENEKQRKEYEARLKKEREDSANKLAEAEKKVKEDLAKELAKIEAEKASQSDNAKWADVVADFNDLAQKYSFSDPTNQKVYNNVGKLISKILGYINEKV